jgi:hypothetical protein
MKEGIWHQVIKDKYLPYNSVATWLRSTTVIQPSAFADLEKLLKSLPLITHWLSWNPGNGHSVLIGLDKILGIDDSSLLSQDLLVALKNKNIRYLFQARAQSSLGFITDQWKSSLDLGLSGSMAIEWNSFCKALIDSGIHLQPRDDILIWTGGDHSGILSVKNVYNALAKKLWPQQIAGWRRHLWTWDLAYKIKLFTWLVCGKQNFNLGNSSEKRLGRPEYMPFMFQGL